MANERRVERIGLGGYLTASLTAAAGATATSPGFEAMAAVGATEYIAIVIDPDSKEGPPEVAYVTSHTAGATTVVLGTRGAETGAGGGVARSHLAGVPWVHGPTPKGVGGADSWVDYTPVWTQATTNPTAGNATLVGRFAQVGKHVTARVALTIGSTTVLGTGAFRLSLPVELAAAVGGAGLLPSLGAAYAVNGGTRRTGVAVVETAGTYAVVEVHGATAPVSETVPAAWATGDVLRFQLAYEAV